jgi:hypothetical protein
MAKDRIVNVSDFGRAQRSDKFALLRVERLVWLFLFGCRHALQGYCAVSATSNTVVSGAPRRTNWALDADRVRSTN